MCENHHVARVEAHEIDARRAAGESMNAIKMASIKAVLKEAARQRGRENHWAQCTPTRLTLSPQT